MMMEQNWYDAEIVITVNGKLNAVMVQMDAIVMVNLLIWANAMFAMGRDGIDRTRIRGRI
jgi:hypothetical protein